MNDTFMKERPVFPLILSMAMPMVISMLVNSLYNIVDSFFVAQISEDAMTALSLVFPVQNFSNAIAIGFGIGISSQIAICLGAGNKETASKAATHGLALSALHGILLTVICISIMPKFLSVFTSDKNVSSLSVRYSTIVFLFAIVTTINLAYEKIFQGVGNMKVTMIGLMVAHKKDSMEICFIPDDDYAGFIDKECGNLVPPPGNFVSKDGKILGRHKGITHYTVGQRKGLGIALGYPVFVTEIRPETNEVVLGSNEDVFTTEL